MLNLGLFDLMNSCICAIFTDLLSILGYAANEDNQMICNSEGIWSPEPFCSPVSEAFPIIQKIGDEMVCLKVSALGNDGTLGGADWHLTTTDNSTDGCETAGNNALQVLFLFSNRPTLIFNNDLFIVCEQTNCCSPSIVYNASLNCTAMYANTERRWE